MIMSTEPLVFDPILKRIRWGGRRLGSRLDKKIGPGTDYAESWEVVDHGADQSRVTMGPWKGRTLHDLVCTESAALLGTHAGIPQFPLLVKFLDAQDRLSVQVHPNDAQATTYVVGERGKTEAWIIMEADPGSLVFAGLKPGISRNHLEESVRTGHVEECLHQLPVQTGDCIFIPAGTVHAIGEGVLLAEVQQSSDITFRLHDWNRMGPDGKPRPLHIQESLDCTDFARGPISIAAATNVTTVAGITRERLAQCPYFTLERIAGEAEFTLKPEPRCRIWIVTAGGISWKSADGQHNSALRGSTLLWPAATQHVSLQFEPETQVIEAFWE